MSYMNEIRIREQDYTNFTDGRFKAVSKYFDTDVAQGQWKEFDFSFTHAIDLLDIYFQSEEKNRGDVVELIVNPGANQKMMGEDYHLEAPMFHNPGATKIGASYIPANVTLRVRYQNNEGSTKKFVFYLNLMY